MNPMRGKARSAGLSATILRAWGHVPSMMINVSGGLSRASGATAPGPGNSKAVPGRASNSSMRG